ncbi:Testis- and ovary-specific PAZ domain-containing protein 1 [Lonchura striata]|uniref:Protein TOPAZ1 n=1 Tax=Lonchura striata TaxID=40157 RepID=A0A218UTN6_9PASE|nr:Testis- and ovary-specific PAZ domain-containing protein 1 [Lonchura striata domestica]
MDFHTPLAEITKEITHKKIDPNIDCQASLETMESSSADIYETLTVNNENGESPVNTDKNTVVFNHDDVQEVKATLTFTAKPEDEGDVTERNLPATVQNGTIKQEDKDEGVATNRNLSVTVQKDTTKQEDKNEGGVTNRNLSVTVQKDTTKQKDKNEGGVTNRNLPATVQNGTIKQGDKDEGVATNRNLSVTVQKNTTKRKDKNEGGVTNRNLPATVQNGTVKQGDKDEGVATNRNLSVTVQKDTTKQKDKNEGGVTNRNLPATVQNGITKQKDDNEGDVTNRNLSVTLQSDTSSSNSNSINFSPKVSIVNQIFSDLNLIKPLTSGNLTKFKIPLCKNKRKFKKQESVHSFERKICSPLELLESTSPGRQKTGEDTFLVKSEQHPLSVMSDARSPASIEKKADEIDSKDFQHNGSVNLSDEMSVFPENFSAYPHPPLDGQPEPSVPDFYGTECLLKSSFPDHSWNAVNHLTGLEINGGRKSRGDFSQHKSQNLPDILEAYNQDVLVIDVIQDDPDLFGASNEEELAPARCENCPVKASSANCIKDTEVYIKPESPITSEKTYSVESSFRCMQESAKSSDTENSYNLVLKAEDVKTHNSSRGSSPSGDVSEDFLKNRQQSKLDELLTLSLDVDEKKYYLAFSACCNFILFQASRSVQQILDALNLPRKYCRYYFMTSRGCERTKCQFCHVLGQGDEKICMAILRTYISIKESGLLKRAVQIFVQYYKEVTPGVDFASEVLNDLLVSLLKNCLLQEVFQILNVIVQIKTLLIDAGMFLELEHLDYIIKLLHQLQVSSWEMSTVLNIKSSLSQVHISNFTIFSVWFSGSSFASIYPLPPLQHCKEKRDWTKLGALYLNARTGCEHFEDLQKLFISIAEILTKDSKTNGPGVPFCDFADTVYSTFLMAQSLNIHKFQFLEITALLSATESEWITDAPLWPCDKMDILNRHNLLCAIVHKYLKKSLYRQAFEVLQNLPGLQKHSDIIDASQHSCLFNKLINACFENKNLGVSSSAVDFMLSKKIAIDFILLRGLITALGRSSLWSKARTYYKNALSLGCYPELQGTLYHKFLKIPSYLSEVEMLLAIEIFLVSNASDIQSSRATSQTLQIILKRSEDTVQNTSAYHEAVERLIQAAHLSDPKLFLKRSTVNVNIEEVYCLEHSSALKWLQENMKWAEKVWLFQ